MPRLETRGCFSSLRWPTPVALSALTTLLLVPRSPLDAFFDPLAILVLSPLVVVLAISALPSPRMQGVCSRAGAISYPLYILHAPVLDPTAHLTSESGDFAASRAVALLGAACFCVVVAWMVERWLEPALARAVRRWTGSLSPAASQTRPPRSMTALAASMAGLRRPKVQPEA